MTYEQLITEFKMICDTHPDCTGCEYDDVGDYWMCALVHGFIRGKEYAIEELKSKADCNRCFECAMADENLDCMLGIIGAEHG